MLHAAAAAQAGDLDSAAKFFQAVALSSSTELASVAREQLGYIYERQAVANTDAVARQAALEQALEAFRGIQSQDGAPRREYALYHEGRMCEQLDKRADAIAAFKKALEVAPDSPIHDDIDDRLTVLEARAPAATAVP
jgi:tetratricopeptide (TPR) repeat protein